MGLKDLAGNVIGKAIQVGLGVVELGYEIFDRPFVAPVEDGQLLIDEGPDDLFPDEDYVMARLSIDVPSEEPELIVSKQWGLQLPNGEVQWNAWQGNTFAHPLDRARLVANLQRTAGDIGLPQGQETDEFLSKYQWVTREQIATVVYGDTGAYPLTDPQVFALGAPESGETSHDNDNSTDAAFAVNGQDSDLGVRPGPVGGDAQ